MKKINYTAYGLFLKDFFSTFRFYIDNTVIKWKPMQLFLKDKKITWYIVLGIFVNILKICKIYKFIYKYYIYSELFFCMDSWIIPLFSSFSSSGQIYCQFFFTLSIYIFFLFYNIPRNMFSHKHKHKGTCLNFTCWHSIGFQGKS